MPRKKKITDIEILRMALDVITNIGSAAFTLEDIRKKTGLSPATLLQRFGSKDKILHGAFELANKKLAHDLEILPVGRDCPLQEIMNLYLSLSTSIKSPLDIANGLDNLKYDITDKKLNNLTRKHFEIRRKKIQTLILLAIEKKKLRPDVDAIEMTWELESLWQGGILLWALIGKGTLNNWLKKGSRFFLKYIYLIKRESAIK